MRKRVFAVARCQSVCLSVTLVNCIRTAEDIDKLLSRAYLTLPIFSGTPFRLSKNTSGHDNCSNGQGEH